MYGLISGLRPDGADASDGVVMRNGHWPPRLGVGRGALLWALRGLHGSHRQTRAGEEMRAGRGPLEEKGGWFSPVSRRHMSAGRQVPRRCVQSGLREADGDGHEEGFRYPSSAPIHAATPSSTLGAKAADARRCTACVGARAVGNDARGDCRTGCVGSLLVHRYDTTSLRVNLSLCARRMA